jgi:hypothetical protein
MSEGIKANAMIVMARAVRVLFVLGLCISGAALNAQSDTGSPQDKTATAGPQSKVPPAKSEAREAWRKSMARHPVPRKGCFEASYPSTEWKEVACVPTSTHPNPPQRKSGGNSGPNNVGDGSGDFDAVTTGLISSAEGSFLSVDGAASEVGGGGYHGSPPPTTPNEWEFQLNTQFFDNPPACNGVSGCLGWQQFLYSQTQCGGACVFIEYWLIGYGATCPPGPWGHPPMDNSDCFYNGPATGVPTQTLADLASLTFTGTATSGGQDTAVLATTSGPLHAVGNDSVLNLANYWNTAEFNIFGDCCSTEAAFSNPTTLVVKTTIDDGTMNPPSCGTESYTNELNNLTMAPVGSAVCCKYGSPSPTIEFMEGNAGHPASCGLTALIGDPHLTTLDGTNYNFQGAGEFVSLREPDGQDIQTRQKPVSTTFIGSDPYDGLTTCVSLNTAVAARVGEHRLTYEPNLSGVPDPSGLQLRIDGALTALGSHGIALGTAGSVIPTGGGSLQVNFPDGKTLFVTPQWWAGQNEWYLDVDVTHHGLVSGEASTTSTGGIVGPIAEGSWLPALPNGASMGPMPGTLPERYNALYKKFADAWRVNKKDSLFDYAAGTSTDTFTMKDWPREQPPCVVRGEKPVEPGSQDVAQAVCRRVADPNRRADCVFDVRATGNVGFATTYLTTQRILADSTTTSLTDDADPSQAGEWVTFTAVVVANAVGATSVPSGTLQFAVDGANVGEPITVDAKGRARWETSRLKVGTHRITASYVPGADSMFLPSTSLEKLQTVKRCSCDADRER